MNRLGIALLLMGSIALASKENEVAIRSRLINAGQETFGQHFDNVVARLQTYQLCDEGEGVRISLNRDDERKEANMRRDRKNDAVRAELKLPLVLGMSYAAFYYGLKAAGIRITINDTIGYRTEDDSEWIGWGYELPGHRTTPVVQMRDACPDEIAQALNISFAQE